jgi:hypothetical protein
MRAASRSRPNWYRGAVAAAGALLVAAVALMPIGGHAQQQSPIALVSDAVENDFPAGITFKLTFTAPSAVNEVRVDYKLAPDGTGATAVADCSGTGTVNCSYALTSGRGIDIIPGANITYHWDFMDAGGDHLATASKLYVHEDTRFAFRTLQSGNVTLYYHAGPQSDAQAVLDTAVQTLHDVSALEGTQVTFPVKVFLYETADEMQPAIAPGQIGGGVQVLGEVVYSDTAMVSADVDTLNITRHEVTHIVTARATKGAYGIASWLNEDISVSQQKAQLSGHEAALASAIRSNAVIPITALGASVGDTPGTVDLFYAESGSIVKHLITTYGATKLAQLLAIFRDGSTPNAAFMQVYGLDELGIENDWRASVGLPPRVLTTATPQSGLAGVPAPTPAADNRGAAAGTPSDGSSTNTVAIAVIAGMVLLVLASGWVLLATLRRCWP